MVCTDTCVWCVCVCVCVWCVLTPVYGVCVYVCVCVCAYVYTCVCGVHLCGVHLCGVHLCGVHVHLMGMLTVIPSLLPRPSSTCQNCSRDHHAFGNHYRRDHTHYRRDRTHYSRRDITTCRHNGRICAFLLLTRPTTALSGD